MATPAPARRSTPYTDTALEITWTNCSTANPAAVALNNILKSCKPRRVEGDRFVVGVNSEAQQKILSDNLPSILEFLHSRLHNDDITVTIELIKGEGSPAIWTETQVLEKILKENPTVRTLAETFKLSLS